MEPTWTTTLLAQLTVHWEHQLWPRLAGLSDDEYFWEPVAGCWSIRPRGTSTAPITAGAGELTIDYAFPPPVPAPVTTIAWRLGHVVVAVLAARNAAHFGGPAVDYDSFTYASGATEALAQLDAEMGVWRAGVASLDDTRLATPCGPAEGPYAEHSMADLVLHIHRELIHHGAEVALLRDLYAHRPLG